MGLISFIKSSLAGSNPAWRKEAHASLETISLHAITMVNPLCSTCHDVLHSQNMQLISEVLFAFLAYSACFILRDELGVGKFNAYIIMAADRSRRAGLVIDGINDAMKSESAVQRISSLVDSDGLDVNSATIRFLAEFTLVLLTNKADPVNWHETVSLLEDAAYGMSVVVKV